MLQVGSSRFRRSPCNIFHDRSNNRDFPDEPFEGALYHLSALSGLTFSTGTSPFRSVHNVPGPE